MILSFLAENSEIILRLIAAIFCGMLIGTERLLVHKEAGIKTHSLVAMGAAVFVLISEMMIEKYSGLSGLNPTMIPGQIIVGIGFLGAGLIMHQGSHLSGLTTASGLWVTAGIGMAAFMKKLKASSLFFLQEMFQRIREHCMPMHRLCSI